MALGVRTSLGLVAESVVGVGENSVKLVLEELRDERSRERKHEGLFYTISNIQETSKKKNTYLVRRSSLLSKSQDGRNRDRQVVTTNIVDLSLLNLRPDLRQLQVLELVLVGGSKVGAHAAVVAGNDDTTLAGGLDIVDTVLRLDTGLGAGLLEEIGVLVFANAANVDDRVVGEHVLTHI